MVANTYGTGDSYAHILYRNHLMPWKPVQRNRQQRGGVRDELASTERSDSITEEPTPIKFEICSTDVFKSGGHDVTPYLVAPPPSGNTTSADTLTCIIQLYLTTLTVHTHFNIIKAINHLTKDTLWRSLGSNRPAEAKNHSPRTLQKRSEK